jgi:TPR repeat protein
MAWFLLGSAMEHAGCTEKTELMRKTLSYEQIEEAKDNARALLKNIKPAYDFENLQIDSTILQSEAPELSAMKDMLASLADKAHAGDSQAQYQLGQMYQTGFVV